MKYRLLGSSGLRVSEASLGTMTFGDERGWGYPSEEGGVTQTQPKSKKRAPRGR